MTTIKSLRIVAAWLLVGTISGCHGGDKSAEAEADTLPGVATIMAAPLPPRGSERDAVSQRLFDMGYPVHARQLDEFSERRTMAMMAGHAVPDATTTGDAIRIARADPPFEQQLADTMKSALTVDASEQAIADPARTAAGTPVATWLAPRPMEYLPGGATVSVPHSTYTLLAPGLWQVARPESASYVVAVVFTNRLAVPVGGSIELSATSKDRGFPNYLTCQIRPALAPGVSAAYPCASTLFASDPAAAVKTVRNLRQHPAAIALHYVVLSAALGPDAMSLEYGWAKESEATFREKRRTARVEMQRDARHRLSPASQSIVLLAIGFGIMLWIVVARLRARRHLRTLPGWLFGLYVAALVVATLLSMVDSSSGMYPNLLRTLAAFVAGLPWSLVGIQAMASSNGDHIGLMWAFAAVNLGWLAFMTFYEGEDTNEPQG